MAALTAFGQWLLDTRETQVLSPDEIFNEATNQSYIGSDLLYAAGKAKAVRGGSQIRENIKIRDGGKLRTVGPGDPRTTTAKNNRAVVVYKWRFLENNETYTDAQILLNEGGDELSMWKKFKEGLKQDLETTHFNGHEAMIWDVPDPLMESGPADSRSPMYSIPALITEDGLVPTQFTAAGVTTIGNVNPSTEPNWRNQRSTYDKMDPFNAQTGVFAAFRRGFRSAGFKVPKRAKAGTFTRDDELAFIVASDINGVTMYENALAAGNDNFKSGGGSDPSYPNAMFRGREINYASPLDGRYAADEPRFFCINPKFLFPCYHPERFMYLHGPVNGGTLQPDTEALFLRSWTNLTCWSRKRQLIVLPG